MTATPEPITLNELECRAVELAARGSREAADWESLRDDFQHLRFPGCPPLDPDAARESAEELRQLTVTLGQQPSSAPITWAAEQLPRAGYFIEGERGTQEAHVRPAFAQALAARASGAELRRAFVDLWSVDLGVWRQLVSGPREHRALAHAWLTSPGRRLVQDLSVLGLLPGEHPPGAGEFSAERLIEATGPLPLEEHPGSGAEPWYELHAAVPGAALSAWRPATDDVSDILRILEGRRGDPVFLRGAALAWLLDRAATNPLYDLNGLQRDLREDLLLAFINGFPDKDESRYSMLRAAARLETACLLHAARLVPLKEAQSSARCWNLARWLQSCTFRSPFFGGDEESLAARLRALLPPGSEAIPRREDVLDPGRFGEGEEGLDIAELALVAGAARHYWPDAEHPQLLPTPLPLVQALRRVASRTLNEGERQAEALLQRLQAPPSTEGALGGEARAPVKVENALGWTAHHVAPPLVARWLMTHHRIAWLGQAPSETQRECLSLFEEDPDRHEWVAFAIYAEGEQLEPGLRLEVPSIWNRVVRATGGRVGSKGALALMAMGVVDRLSGDEEARVAELLREAEPSWRHRGFEALAEAAEKHGRSTSWRAALDGLLAMCADESLDVQERQRAALLALRRASATSRPERTEYLQRLASLASRAPFNQNVALRRELRRLGLSSASESKGER
jgi:hypothetical protein